MIANLNLATLRSFVLVAQGRTFAQTAEAIGRTQSAVSLQIQKLEADVGKRLFRRNHSAGIDLTNDGERFLTYAKQILQLNDEAVLNMNVPTAGPIRFGVTPDFADMTLQQVLRCFGQEYPSTELMLRIDGSTSLVEAVGRDELDLAIALNVNDALNQGVIAEAKMLWIARQGFDLPDARFLPLGLSDPPCPFRATALNALSLPIPYRIVASSSSVGGVIAAVRAGLCVTVRTKHFLMGELSDVGEELELPELPSVPFNLYARVGDRHAERDDLVEMCKRYFA